MDDFALVELAEALSAGTCKGFTVSLVDGSTPTVGYAVGGDPECPEVKIGNVETLPVGFIAESLRYYAKMARMYGDERMGGWVEDGDLYLDAPTIYVDGEEAERVARERKEKAYFDLATGATHYVS